jgi:hypothetical protein
MSKILFCDEWVKARPFFNKSFRASGHCEICSRLSCAPGWHSIKSGKFRCVKCFDAEAAHYGTPRIGAGKAKAAQRK